MQNKEISKLTDSLSGNKQFPGVLDSTSETPWVRENVFLNDNLYLQQGFGYQLNNYQDVAEENNPDSYKIVLFGDSFAWGNGNSDWANLIGNELERELNAPTQSNIFEVITRARNGRSIYNHYDFFRAYSLNQLNPQMVIYNFYVNDPIPSFTEELICGERGAKDCNSDNPHTSPIYQNCLRGEGSFPAKLFNLFRSDFPLVTQKMLTRYCEPKLKNIQSLTFDFGKVLLDPPTSPYYDTWLETLPLLQKELAPFPIHVANLYTSPVHTEANKILMKDMKDAGYPIIPMKQTLKEVGDKMLSKEEEQVLDSKLMINPGNTHASSFLTRKFALDMAEYIRENINKKAYAAAKIKASKIRPDQLVTHTMPSFAVEVVSKDANQAKITFNKENHQPYDQKIGEGKPLPFQYANCLNLGYSNFQIMLSNGSTGSLSVQGLDNSIKTKLGFYYYDEEHVRLYQELNVKITNNLKVKIPYSKGNPALVIGFPEYGNGCAINKVIDAPNFKLQLERLPS